MGALDFVDALRLSQVRRCARVRRRVSGSGVTVASRVVPCIAL
jgi:hypothetical protein